MENDRIVSLTYRCRRKHFSFGGRWRRSRPSPRGSRGLKKPALAYAEVEFVTSIITAVQSIAHWADEVEFGV